ncbi:HumD family translesion DNA polymerase [Enterobacter kobei]|uniref:HumD family translesion DNA polymerase n=1 Tax=Enterobacter kobei TaxID=208224 RepID=UPI00403F31B3
MGFPSPAQDYVEERISLDKRIITRPAATYFIRAGATHYREGIMNGALLVVDASLNPCDGSLLVCRMEGELRIKRYRKHPHPHLEDLQTGRREEIPVHDDGTSPDSIFWVITYCINNMRLGEFDDCPVM